MDDVPIRDYIDALIVAEQQLRAAEIESLRARMAKADDTLTIRLENEAARAIESRESRYALRTDIATLQDRLDREVSHLSEDISDVRTELAKVHAGGQVTNARLTLVGTGIILLVAGVSAFIQVTL